ncbi:MAG TPA: hypothetical protein VMB34_15490 [Acetobacteraceae bacterium]|nr:hypothetical protein [Acetobacteraceae bacterium]
MHLYQYVSMITGKPDGQWAVLAFDVGVAGAPQPPVGAFVENFEGAAASVRGPWMAASKSAMAQNTSVHTETMLINRLREYLNGYIATEGRRPYSIGLYSKYSPCLHCVALLTRVGSGAKLPGSAEVATVGPFGFADGFATDSPSLSSSVGLCFFDCDRWYVDASKHSDTVKKSWYATVDAARNGLQNVYAGGWQRFIDDPLPELTNRTV